MCEWLKYTTSNGECLEWTRALNSDGYPRAGRKGNTNIKVHREVYKEHNSQEDINGKVIRHSCDNRKCINPKHLLSGSVVDNINDMDSRNRRHRKVTAHAVEMTFIYLDLGFSQKETGSMLGLDPRRISDIKMGRYTTEGRLAKKES